MSRERTSAELEIHVGSYRSFEWHWASNGAMPGLDAFEMLPEQDQIDFTASVRHWGNVPYGKKALQTRINDEYDDPKIVAIKAGKHRFTAFREESGPTWIVADYYLKEGEKRDKTGDRAIKRTITARNDYFQKGRGGNIL